MGRKNMGNLALNPREGTSRKSNTKFEQLNGRRVAFVLRQGENPLVFKGLANYQRDDELGNVLKIADNDDLGHPALLITEEDWKGLILPDERHGCDVCMIPYAAQEDADDASQP